MANDMPVPTPTATAVDAGISTDDQKEIILVEMLRLDRSGRYSRSQDLWRAIEARMSGRRLSDGGKATIRWLINTPIQEQGWVHLRPGKKQGWLLTDNGRIEALRLEARKLEAEHPPTADEAELEERVRKLLETGVHSRPVGRKQPQFVDLGGQRRPTRDPLVKAWVLQQAGGRCEVCCSGAPFVSAHGAPYLEVHHVDRLADGGEDTVDNTAAVCPNCHRALHYAADAGKRSVQLRQHLQQVR